MIFLFLFMNWEKVSKLEGKQFRRYTGIYRKVYMEMLDCIKQIKTSKRKHPTKGVSSSMSIEEQLLMVIMYWREYRDQYHLAIDYGISQSTVSRIICDIENLLIKSGQFSIPGRKSLSSPDSSFEIVIADVTETPTQRPKKTETKIQRQKETTYAEITVYH